MFELPTRSTRTYHGKFPSRVHSVGYSNSSEQVFISGFLGIKRAVHIELNCGRRFIACISEVRIDEKIIGRDIMEVILENVVQPLTQDRYDEMLTGIRRKAQEDGQASASRK